MLHLESLYEMGIDVNEELCGSSELKFVGSASAGTNHLDKEFLNKRNISWSNSSKGVLSWLSQFCGCCKKFTISILLFVHLNSGWSLIPTSPKNVETVFMSFSISSQLFSYSSLYFKISSLFKKL